MKTSFTKQQISLSVACILALGFASGAARAQNFGPPSERELWTDTPARQVWKNGYGECWHSAFGPPPASAECDPRPTAQYVAPAPAQAQYVAPAPAKAQYVAPAPAPAPVIVPIERPRKKDRN